MFLTDEEVRRLTGKKRFRAQVKALTSMGVAFQVRPDGKPIVREDYAASISEEKKRHAKPNFEALSATQTAR
jgi:hypothetical protein